jgi:hypothetical protein
LIAPRAVGLPLPLLPPTNVYYRAGSVIYKLEQLGCEPKCTSSIFEVNVNGVVRKKIAYYLDAGD